MNKVKIVGLDPALSNFGIAKVSVDVATLKVDIEELILVETAPDERKTLVKSSDDLRRARECQTGMVRACQGRAFAIAELPFFHAQMYPSAIHNTGLSLGILASCPIPLIGVTPQDVKLAALGSRVGSKEEMIEWAKSTYPDAPWLTRKVRGSLQLVAKNEHLADAVAVVHAGLHTEAFKQALSMLRSMAA